MEKEAQEAREHLASLESDIAVKGARQEENLQKIRLGCQL